MSSSKNQDDAAKLVAFALNELSVEAARHVTTNRQLQAVASVGSSILAGDTNYLREPCMFPLVLVLISARSALPVRHQLAKREYPAALLCHNIVEFWERDLAC